MKDRLLLYPSEPERRRKISIALKNRVLSESTLKKLRSNALLRKGKKLTDGQKRRLVIGHERYARKIGMFVNCRQCGEELKRKKRSSKFCSKKCGYKHRNLKTSAVCKNCGKSMLVPPCILKRRSYCSRSCMGTHYSLYKTRENSPSWKGGIKKDRDRRKSYDGVVWRKAVFKRDNYMCKICGERGGYIEADHIKPYALFPELRFDVSNGRTLCRECHKNTQTYGSKTRNLESKKKKVRETGSTVGISLRERENKSREYQKLYWKKLLFITK